jgi:hypothetical protein
VDALVAGLSSPPLPGAVTLTVLPEGPWHDVQPRGHPHLAVKFGFTEADLTYEARTMIEQHRQVRAANADLYGDANDHGRPLAVLPNTVVNLVAHRLAVGVPAVAVNTTADGIVLNPYTMNLADAAIASRRLREVLAWMLPTSSKL